MDVEDGCGGEDQRRLSQSSLLPKDPAPGDLSVYENEADVRSLIAWLNESGQREGPLHAALLRAFPPPPPPSATRSSSGADCLPMDVESAGVVGGGGEGESAVEPQSDSGKSGFRRGSEEYGLNEAATGGGGGGKERRGDATSADVGADEGPFNGEFRQGEEDGEGEGEEAEDVKKDKGGDGGGGGGRRRGRGGNASSEPRATQAHPKRSQELPRLLAEGAVELKMAVNPPGAHGNVMLPASEAVVEVDDDAQAEQVRVECLRLSLWLGFSSTRAVKPEFD